MKTFYFNQFTENEINALKRCVREGIWGDTDYEFYNEKGEIQPYRAIGCETEIKRDRHYAGCIASIVKKIRATKSPVLTYVEDYWDDGSGNVLMFNTDTLDTDWEGLKEWAREEPTPAEVNTPTPAKKKISSNEIVQKIEEAIQELSFLQSATECWVVRGHSKKRTRNYIYIGNDDPRSLSGTGFAVLSPTSAIYVMHFESEEQARRYGFNDYLTDGENLPIVMEAQRLSDFATEMIQVAQDQIKMFEDLMINRKAE